MTAHPMPRATYARGALIPLETQRAIGLRLVSQATRLLAELDALGPNDVAGRKRIEVAVEFVGLPQSLVAEIERERKGNE